MIDEAKELSPQAVEYFTEFWHRLWHGKDPDRLISDKKAELRTKYGQAAEDEIIAWLRKYGRLNKEEDGIQ